MNFIVHFKLNRTIFIPEAKDAEEARTKALDHLLNLLNSGIKEFVEIEVIKTGD